MSSAAVEVHTTSSDRGHFSNAPDLIREYFAGVDKKKGSTPKSKRPKEKDTESEERAKTKKSKKDSDKHSSTSNGRTSLRTLSKVADADTEMDLSIKAPSQTAFASMEPYFHKETWEDIIERILTVDYSQDMSNTVIYFLQLWVPSLTPHRAPQSDFVYRKSGEQTAASGDWMGKKAPAMVRIEALSLCTLSDIHADYPILRE